VSGVLVSKEKKSYFVTIGGIFLVFIGAVLGYRRPAACNTELRGLLIVIYNVGYCLGSTACFQIWK
jgi:hypothetical protein